MAKNDVVRVVRELPRKKKEPKEEQIRRIMEERDARTPRLGRPDPSHTPVDEQRVSLPEYLASKLPTGASRDAARMAVRGVARTGNMILRTLDLPNRVFGNSRSLLQDVYERSEANMARDGYEDTSGAPQVGETAVHLATAGVFGKALPAVFGANTGADTYEIAKYSGAPEGEAVMKGVGHGVLDTAIWTLGQGLASKYLPKSWQWLGRELTGAGRGAASSVTSDAVLNSLGADISGEEMAKRAVHAAWMVPLLGMLKMGGKRREEAMSLLRKARPDLAGGRADKVIETIEAEFADPKSQKVALAWVARKGANLPDDTAQIKQALEVSSKVKGLDPMSKSPFEILSNPAYARYLPKPKPQDVKAFSNMKRYPMGVIGFDVSDDAAGRQATREMINAYMSPSSNPWCLATGKDAAKLGGLGPDAKGYWESHSAVPKQILFQEVDGKLELTAFRATSPGGEGQQEYWDTSDAGYSGIPIKVKVPGDPMGRYRKMVFRPEGTSPARVQVNLGDPADNRSFNRAELQNFVQNQRIIVDSFHRSIANGTLHAAPESVQRAERVLANAERALETFDSRVEETAKKLSSGEVQGTFEDIAPGRVFKGDPFRDGRSQTWVSLDKQEQQKSDGTGVGFGHSVSEIDGPIDIVVGREGGDFPTIEAARAELQRVDSRPQLNDFEATREEIAEDREYYGAYRQALVQAIEGAVRNSRPVEPSGETPQYALVEDKVRTTENGITKFRTTRYADPTDLDYEPPKPGEPPKPVEIEESELVSPEWMRSRGYDPENEADVRRMQQELDIQAWGNGQEAAMAVVPTKRTYMQTKSGTPETVTYGPNGYDVVSVDFEENGVPYREEYLNIGRYANQVVGGIPPELRSFGVDITGPIYGAWRRGQVGDVRLIRNPGKADAEVVSETRYDKDLGTFVQTVGNRRAYIKRQGPSKEERDRASAYEDAITYRLAEYTAGEGAYPAELPDGTVVMTRDQVRDLAHVLRINADGYTYPRYTFPMLAAFSENFPNAAAGIMSDLPTIRNGRPQISRVLRVEDRQPDGTWAPAEAVELPSQTLFPDYPNNIPFALKAGRTRRNVRAAEGGGDTSGAPGASVPSSAPAQPGGPRIVINPQVFSDKRDALCVAFDEALRLVMEENGFEPVSEPTEAQRKFFADTAYANDELQLRRTILARIATLDTSVKDPTDEQLEETAEMLEMVMEVGAPQNEWEQSAVQRLHDVVVRMRESPRSPAPTEKPKETGSTQAAEGAGVAMTGAELDFLRRRYESGASMNAQQRALVEAADAQGVNRGEIKTVEFSLNPPENAQAAQPVQPVQPVAQPAAQPAQPVQPVQPVAQPAAQPAQQPQGPVVKATTTGGETVDWNGKPTSGAGMYVPNKDELAFLRRRRDSGASLSPQQRRILELTDGNYST